jgi:calcineurin-like phosphoesterase family protein
MIRALPGHKRLVLGNHDHYQVGVYVEAGFQKVRASNLIDGVLMTHYPVHPSSITFKTVGNAHGHIHQNPSPEGPYFNCSVEAIGYEPIPFEDVRDILLARKALAEPGERISWEDLKQDRNDDIGRD